MKLGHDLHQNRTQDVRISENVDFDRLLLNPNILQGLKECGFKTPSPIQYHGIPLGKCGFDLLLEAKSGTGKTVVFSVITLQQLDVTKRLQAIILAPTREIAAQVCDVIKQIGSKCEGLKVEVVMGGLPIKDDIQNLQKVVHVLVGSPGRLRHLIQNGHVDTSSVRLLVLDEADKLMEKSFQSDIDYIFSILPKQKQVIMSSATYPEESMSFLKEYVQNAQHIRPNNSSVLVGIKQMITVVEYNANIVMQTEIKFKELLEILSNRQFKQCLIYCNYQARVKDLYKMLLRAKWPAQLLHGHQEQILRLDALKTLQEYRCRILVATDLAARGLDAINLDMVINFETPSDWTTYLHRIGRAGRFGQLGDAINIVSKGTDKKKFMDIFGSMEEALDLYDLWSNEKLYFDDSVNSCTDIKEDETSQCIPLDISTGIEKPNVELWNALTTTELDHGYNEIESFEKLCSSFEKLNSNNNNDYCEMIGEYKHLELKKIPIKKYFAYIQDIKNYSSDFNETKDNSSKTPVISTEGLCSENKSLVKSKEIDNTGLTKNFKQTLLNGLNEDCVTENFKEIKSNYSENELLKIRNNENKKIRKNDRKSTCTNKKLNVMNKDCVTENLQKVEFKDTQTELSKIRNNKKTSISEKPINETNISSYSTLNTFNQYNFKNCRNKSNTKTLGKHNKNENFDNTNVRANLDVPRSTNKMFNRGSDAYERSTNLPNYQSKYRKQLNHITNPAVDEYDDCGYNTQSYEHLQYKYRPTKYERQERKYRKSNYSGSYSHKGQYCDSGRLNSGSVLSSEYINWYSQFKVRMKQIELSQYIYELSQL